MSLRPPLHVSTFNWRTVVSMFGLALYSGFLVSFLCSGVVCFVSLLFFFVVVVVVVLVLVLVGCFCWLLFLFMLCCLLCVLLLLWLWF